MPRRLDRSNQRWCRLRCQRLCNICNVIASIPNTARRVAYEYRIIMHVCEYFCFRTKSGISQCIRVNPARCSSSSRSSGALSRRTSCVARRASLARAIDSSFGARSRICAAMDFDHFHMLLAIWFLAAPPNRARARACMLAHGGARSWGIGRKWCV